VGGRMDLFKEKNSNLYNFRCPYCGDSQKQKSKARGYFFTKGSDIIFKCHNCAVGRTLGNFLKDNARDLYDQFVMERYREGLTGKSTRVETPKFDSLYRQAPKFNTGTKLPTISSLNKEHPARAYLEQRKLPQESLDRIYYADRFKKFVNSKKQTFDNLQNDRPRIIIPLADFDGNWFGIQGRALSPTAKLRYITVIFDETKPKLFGLDKVDKSRTVYVTEGPLDSLFIRNSIAMCGSDADPSKWGINDTVWIYDNEPRNQQIVSRISRSIELGQKVVIFPASVKEKDLNDMLLAGHDVQHMVESNTYQGLEAKLKFTGWKKV
jgi:hypothetical protein